LFVPNDVLGQTQSAQLDGAGESVNLAGGSLTFYILAQSEIANPIESPLIPRMLLPDYPNAPKYLLLLPNTSFSAWRMSRSCAGYVGGSFRGGVTAPAISAKAAATADRNMTSTITALSGHFESPLYRLFHNGGWSALYQKLRLWRLYQREPALIGNAFYIREFDGIMMRRDKSASFNFSSNAAVNASFASVNASVQANYSQAADFDATAWRSIIFSDASKPQLRMRRFEPAPTVAEIVAALKGATVQVEGTDQPLRGEAPYDFTYVVQGIPPDVCQLNWVLQVGSDNVFRDVQPVTVQPAFTSINKDTVPTCAFKIVATPVATLIGPDKPVRFSATIHTVETLANSAIIASQQVLSLDIQQTFHTTDEPIPALASGRTAMLPVTTTTGRFIPTWNVYVDFGASTKEPAVTIPGVRVPVRGDASTPCAGVNYVLLPSAVVDQNGKYAITIRATAELSFADYDIGGVGDACAYTMSLQVPLAKNPQGRSREVPVSVTLQFPPRKTPAVTPK
jgi:hypothetical protein